MVKATKAKVASAVVASIALVACLAFFGCAPQERDLSTTGEDASSAASGETQDDAATQGVAFTWTAESDCAMCHDKEASSQQDSACTASQHANEPCVTCHADEAGLASAHEGAQMGGEGAAALVKTKVDDAVCQSCHDQAELATKTADSTVLTDSEGTVVNPHELPENEDHAATECISCHKMHSTTDISKTATRYCKSCHHTDVYSCYTCHA